MSKRYSVRKMGVVRGNPHYSAECNLHSPPRVLSPGNLSKDSAMSKVREHMLSVHGITL